MVRRSGPRTSRSRHRICRPQPGRDSPIACYPLMLVLVEQVRPVPQRRKGHRGAALQSRNSLPANAVLGFETEADAKTAAGSSRKRKQEALTKKAAPTVRLGVRPVGHRAGVYVRAVGKAKRRRGAALQKEQSESAYMPLC